MIIPESKQTMYMIGENKWWAMGFGVSYFLLTVSAVSQTHGLLIGY